MTMRQHAFKCYVRSTVRGLGDLLKTDRLLYHRNIACMANSECQTGSRCANTHLNAMYALLSVGLGIFSKMTDYCITEILLAWPIPSVKQHDNAPTRI